MIIPKRWQDVTPGTRVIDPAGQRFHVIAIAGPFVLLGAVPSGKRISITVSLPAFIPTVLEPEDLALANLRAHFPSLEYLKG